MTIDVSRAAVASLHGSEQQLQANIEFLHATVESMRERGISSARASKTLTRSQATKIVTALGQLKSLLDVNQIIKRAGDLTKQTAQFVALMEQIDRRYGDEARRDSEDLRKSLTSEQLLIVYEMVAENKRQGLL